MGKKTRKGVTSKQDALVFYVEKKLHVATEDMIPATIDGVPTDVVEVGKITFQLLPPCEPETMQQRITPVRGGIQVGVPLEQGYSVGTMGAILKVDNDNRLVGLTCSHVAYNPYWAYMDTGDPDDGVFLTAKDMPIYQPNPDENEDNEIGYVHDDVPVNYTGDNYVDASVFTINPERGVTVGITGLTKKPQSLIPIEELELLQTVVKAGRTTGITYGNISSLSATVNVYSYNGSLSTYLEQIIITPSNPSKPFSDLGDSGSVVCVDLGNGYVGIIGLLIAGNENLAVITPIQFITSSFNLIPWDGSLIVNSTKEFMTAGGGNVFSKFNQDMLQTTNDFFCDNDTYEGLLKGCTGFINIENTFHELTTRVNSFTGGKIELIYFQKDIVCNVEADVLLSIVTTVTLVPLAEMEATLHIECVATTLIDNIQGCNANVNIHISSIAETNIESVAQANGFGSIDLKIDCSCEANIQMPLNPVIAAYLKIDSDSSAHTNNGESLDTSININLEIILDANANTGVLDFSSDDNIQDACQYDEWNEIIYGG